MDPLLHELACWDLEDGGEKSSTSPPTLLLLLKLKSTPFNIPSVSHTLCSGGSVLFESLEEVTLTGSSWSLDLPQELSDAHTGPHSVQDAAANDPLGHRHGNVKI